MPTPTSTGKLEFKDVIGGPEAIAAQISDQFLEWQSARVKWLQDRREILEYIFATDTQGTAAGQLPWKNSTHIPKICQIRDNLHANYMAALFPNDRPYKWEGSDDGSETLTKRKSIESYMHNKLRLGDWKNTVSKLVLDYIDYGNCFGSVESVYETKKNEETGEMEAGYIGPKVVRIPPADILFNPAAVSFKDSGKIIRSINTLGSLKALMETRPELGYLEEVFKKIESGRINMRAHQESDFVKNTSFQMAGFTDFYRYFTSNTVEIIDYYGDVYNPETQEIQTNRVITVVDRTYVIRNEALPTMHTFAPIHHAGWRLRPDNLMAMGPLDNLIGMQYRIDHLENVKADAYDLIVHPVMKVKGFVEPFNYGPGERVHVGDDGEVEFMRPDVTMLSADTQIAMYENKMEEMAGAPKQAMGFRTPGEKTKYEVQVLENGANKVFINKTAHFESTFLEPLLNDMLISARENLEMADTIRVIDDDSGVIEFMEITPEDLKASGKLYPIGSRHFQRDANTLQSLTQLSQAPLMADPSVKNHFSGFKLAKLVEQLMGVERYDLVEKNIGIVEALESEQQMQAAKQIIGEQQAGKAEAAAGGPPPQQQQPQGPPQ